MARRTNSGVILMKRESNQIAILAVHAIKAPPGLFAASARDATERCIGNHRLRRPRFAI
jgi:hypothetical protein